MYGTSDTFGAMVQGVYCTIFVRGDVGIAPYEVSIDTPLFTMQKREPCGSLFLILFGSKIVRFHASINTPASPPDTPSAR